MGVNSSDRRAASEEHLPDFPVGRLCSGFHESKNRVRMLPPPSEDTFDIVTRATHARTPFEMRPSLFALMLLNTSGATGKTILRPSPTAVLKLRGGGLVPLRKLGTAMVPVGNNLAAGWHGWCTLTAAPVAVSTVTALTWLSWAARKPGSGRDLLRKLWRGSLAGITEGVKLITIAFSFMVLCAGALLCTLARDRSISRDSLRAAVTSMFTTSWSRIWNGFKFSSGIIGIVLLQLAVPPQYQKILLVCSCMPMGAAVSLGNWKSDITFLEMTLVMGLVTAFNGCHH